jgi:glycosyl transferase family 25
MPAIVVISLRGSNRRKACDEQLRRLELPYEFVDAIDGRSLSEREVEKSYQSILNLTKFKRPMTRAEIGCYLSHRAVWRRARDEARPFVVLEDDFTLADDFKSFISAIPDTILRDCLVKLDVQDSQRARFQNKTTFDLGPVTVGLFRVVPPCTTGYVIGPQAAAQLLAATEVFFRPVDIDIKHQWEHNVPILGTAPALVSQRLGKADSLLERDRDSMKPASRLKRLTANLKYQLGFRWKLWSHRMREMNMATYDLKRAKK